MSLRLLSCSLLLAALAIFKIPVVSQSQSEEQPPEKPHNGPKWEYKVLRLDAGHCSLENAVETSLNEAGQQGWELVNYERHSLAYPKDAEGTLLIRPAATGPGRETTPQTADSFEGTINLKMPQVQPGDCRLLFKRMVTAPAKP